jgi:nuclear transport factor 2 (NTF2) superfamily protein
MDRPPLPPFTEETATQKARMAEDAWNTRDPARVALAYTVDSRWRNRAECLQGRAEIEAFLTRKWQRELDYRLIKQVWAFRDNRIAVRFAYEWHDDSGSWFRSYGNENWEFVRARPHAPAHRQHQRPADQGGRPQVPLAARSEAGRSSLAERPRVMKMAWPVRRAIAISDCILRGRDPRPRRRDRLRTGRHCGGRSCRGSRCCLAA